MFKMIIELDEKRMESDGLSVKDKLTEIDHIVSELDGITQIEKGIFVSDNSGIRSWFNEQLEEIPWFMKYVSRWEIDDPTVKDNIILALREMGIRCGYE